MKRLGFGVIMLFLGCAGAVSAQDSSFQYLQAGNSLFTQKNYDMAIRYYDAALQINTQSWQAFQGLGNCYYAKGDSNDALTNYKKALDINPNNPQLSPFVQSLQTGAGASPVGGGVSAGQDGYKRGGEKSPILAGLLSLLVPGVGQYYNGRPEDVIKGLIIDGVYIGSIALIVVGSSHPVSSGVITYNQQGYPIPPAPPKIDDSLIFAGVLILAADHLYGIVDAITSADDINRNHSKRSSGRALGIDMAMLKGPGGLLAPGAELSLKF